MVMLGSADIALSSRAIQMCLRALLDAVGLVVYARAMTITVCTGPWCYGG